LNLWLLDSSVLLASEDPDDENHTDARRLLGGSDPLATLDLAFYEVTNVGLMRADAALIADAAAVAYEHGISVYDAAYVVAARVSGGELVSCDLRDLVSRGLARLPRDALTLSLAPEQDPVCK
jgi:predicted nucleic acid-binding protein